MPWFKRGEEEKEGKEKREELKPSDQLWVKCNSCNEIIYRKVIERNLQVCPKCNYHFQIPARRRIDCVVDPGTFVEYDSGLISTDPIEFKDSKRYPARIKESQEKTGQKDAIICGEARIEGQPAMIGIFEFNFMGGSLGSVVGEKITRLIERAIEKRIGVVIFCASGGARMQEGIFSLMQMAKTSAALAKLHEARISYISVLTDPTTGGVSASIAMLGDIIIAEPKAMIGFAGPRVIKETIREELPEGFQRAEYLLEHGMVDLIVERKDLRHTLASLLEMLKAEG
ncbi:MAG: acetyl-CoA carboxylase carboxyl transferase subunit beta [Deltaproteobacteria bacterium CG03_land_8_20_14_0_80_45_14]|nr:MAG: acetyl-CoA carboxylase carboxyl transferase subunit beta [Deltaproteobacteria bacterium CG03_land_8_20_14_0_80_45_14]